eukprot:scaffold2263_cov33-Tisochrysis_lutea.AAC.1
MHACSPLTIHHVADGKQLAGCAMCGVKTPVLRSVAAFVIGHAMPRHPFPLHTACISALGEWLGRYKILMIYGRAGGVS